MYIYICIICIYIYIKSFGKNTHSQMMGICREIMGKFRIRHGVPRLRIYIYICIIHIICIIYVYIIMFFSNHLLLNTLRSIMAHNEYPIRN